MAVIFKNKFNDIKQLINQIKNVNKIAYQNPDDQWLLYLIIKNNYNDKPKFYIIFKTLKIQNNFA
jgi:hypothetical protein